MTAVDEFELADDRDNGGETGARSRRRSPSRARAWVATSAGLVMAGALNASPVPIVLGAPGIPFGLLDSDIDGAPTVVWESDLADSYVADAGDGWLVLNSDDTGQERSVLGLDLETGTETWRYHDADYTCQWSAGIACVERPGTPDATIVLIEPTDGARESQPYPGALAAIPVADGLVVVAATDTANEDVLLIEADGSERWRVSEDAGPTDTEHLWMALSVSSNAVTLALTGRSIDLETGEPSLGQVWEMPGGAEMEFTADGSMVVHTADRRITLGTNEPLIPFDDDLGGPVIVQHTANEELVASLRVDQSELWRVAAPGCHPVARLHGAVVTQCWDVSREEIVALDGVTGETRWELPNASVLSASASTLLVVDHDQEALLGLDPSDGSPRWSLPTSLEGYPNVMPISGGIVVVGASGLMRLRWD